MASVTESRAEGWARLDALNAAEARPTRITAPWALRLLATGMARAPKTALDGSTLPVERRTRAAATGRPPAAARTRVASHGGA